MGRGNKIQNPGTKIQIGGRKSKDPKPKKSKPNYSCQFLFGFWFLDFGYFPHHLLSSTNIDIQTPWLMPDDKETR
jgi:hypothetical protein